MVDDLDAKGAMRYPPVTTRKEVPSVRVLEITHEIDQQT